jgi:hypothetical protein
MSAHDGANRPARSASIFANLVLADEINRATPKTQSSLLEAMQEHQVTVARQRYPLDPPFFVLATQNPLEMEGTYPLPEAQLDRFLFKVMVPFPSEEDLVAIMDRTTGANRAAQLGADLSSVFAPFDRLGKPGDPSYVAGTGGDGQTQQGSQVGSGSNNGALTPYQQVYSDFQQYAQTSLDRGYVPLSIKDYVREYFSSLDPSN